jgi:folate-dependent phosphoribosylglycinamide formyltransferase PurN
MLRAVPQGREASLPLRVAVLCSRRAPGLAQLIDRSRQGGSFVVAGVLTSDAACVEGSLLAGGDVPLVDHDIRRFYARRALPLRDLGARAEYDAESIRRLAPFEPDVVALCGYLHIVTSRLLDAYPNRVINIHDSDLPRFRGLHGVRDAVFAGERVTRSTVHVATEDVDGGPPLVRSWAFPTHPLIHAARRWGAADILKAFAYAQREWMMRECWGALLGAAIDLFADGRVQVRDGGCVIDGVAGPLDLSAMPPGGGVPADRRLVAGVPTVPALR